MRVGADVHRVISHLTCIMAATISYKFSCLLPPLEIILIKLDATARLNSAMFVALPGSNVDVLNGMRPISFSEPT